MRQGAFIYNLDGMPFRSEAIASRMLELLKKESGNEYRIESYPGGGFVLAGGAGQRGTAPPGTSGATASDNASDQQTPSPLSSARQPEARHPNKVMGIGLRPAIIRTHPVSFAMIVLLALFLAIPELIVEAVLYALPFSFKGTAGLAQTVAGYSTKLAALPIAYLWGKLMWLRYSALYRITEFGVEARLGIIARQSVGLRFQDIRSMSVKQSMCDRLLNVGLLEFTSAGTDGMPVQFANIARPNKTLLLVKDKMAATSSVV